MACGGRRCIQKPTYTSHPPGFLFTRLTRTVAAVSIAIAAQASSQRQREAIASRVVSSANQLSNYRPLQLGVWRGSSLQDAGHDALWHACCRPAGWISKALTSGWGLFLDKLITACVRIKRVWSGLRCCYSRNGSPAWLGAGIIKCRRCEVCLLVSGGWLEKIPSGMGTLLRAKTKDFNV